MKLHAQTQSLLLAAIGQQNCHIPWTYGPTLHSATYRGRGWTTVGAGEGCLTVGGTSTAGPALIDVQVVEVDIDGHGSPVPIHQHMDVTGLSISHF